MRGWLARKYVAPALLGVAAFANVFAFINFNPLQSAHPIFDRPETRLTAELRAEAAGRPDGVVVRAGFPAAVLNGWGFRSASHVLPAPQTEFFKRLLPDVSADEVDALFNRYVRIGLTSDLAPQLIAPDSVVLPTRAFAQAFPGQASPPLVPAPHSEATGAATSR